MSDDDDTLRAIREEATAQERLGNGDGGAWESGYASAWADVRAILAGLRRG